MTDSKTYVASAGQTHIPFQENSGVPFVSYEKPAKPEPPLAPLELTPEAKAKGYALWAPGSHKRFNWLRTPYEYGFEDSVHIIAETTDPALPVFGGNGVEIHRLHLTEFYLFTTALGHVICEGVFNDAGELVDSTVHEWEDVPGGIVHITATVQNTKASMPPRFVLDILTILFTCSIDRDSGTQSGSHFLYLEISKKH
ncbi:MAG: hypothetical protein J6D57_02095 [Mogibacterium sp.]|nr:hypothetical protein [Mogibacterium sp.]